MSARIINKVSDFLKQSDSAKWNQGNEKCLKENQSRDLVSLLNDLGNKDENRLVKCLYYQWAEAALLWGQTLKEGGTQGKQILIEINKYLERCSYFVGYSRSIADVFMYHLLYDILENMTPSERKRIPCLCRWFNHIQQEASLRQGNPLINFSASFLSPTLSPGY